MSSDKLNSAKRRKATGSQASLGIDNQIEMSSRPASPHSRNAWSAENDVTDDIDFPPRASGATAVDVAPTGMEAETVSHQKQISTDGRAGEEEQNVPVSCWTRFKRIIRSLWRTRQTDDVDCDKELHIKTTLRELVIYLFFITILCILTFGMTSSTMYYFTKVMKDLFVETTMSNRNTFKDITTMAEFFMYASGPLFAGIYWEKFYNEKNVTNKNLKEGELGYIYFENKILGRPRLRQLRVKNDSCVVHKDFSNVIKECYASYAPSIEDKATFGKQNGTAWVYQTEEKLKGRGYWGQLATYKGGGFTQLLEPTKDESDIIIAELKDNLWLDRATRAVFVDFSVYNANINLFCIIRLLFEYPATGGCIPSFNFRTLKLIRYVTGFDHFVMACEGIFFLFLIYYTIEEIIEIRKHKLQYFKCVWNILDVVVLLLGYIAVLFHLYRTVVVGNLLEGLLDDPNQYANFDNLGYWQAQFNNLIAIAVFFSWIKVFKYISFNKTMTQLSSTLAKCAKDVAGFTVMFFIIFFAYAQLGYLIFGTQVRDFSTFGNSTFTLFRIILGDFDFHQIENANRVLGPIFFITYVFFVFFVLLNMFLAIINDTYAEVKSDIALQQSEFEIGDYFKKGYQKVVDKLSIKREKIADIQKALQSADVNQDSKLDFEEWRAELKSRGHADAEIEAVFAKYDVDGDRVLDEDECKKMQEDLEGQKAELNEEIEEIERAKEEGRPTTAASRVSIRDSDMDSDDDVGGGLHGRSGSPSLRRRGGGGGGVSHEEFNVLSRRVDRMEHSIGSIVSKIDAVLVKLEAMEKAKLKRRETMAKLLDSITEGAHSKSEENLKRDQMEKLVREELERWDSEASLRSGSESRAGSTAAASRPGSRVPTARSMYGQRKESGTSRGGTNAQASTGSVRMQAGDGINNTINEQSQV